jgi:signal transduction histidine kinase
MLTNSNNKLLEKQDEIASQNEELIQTNEEMAAQRDMVNLQKERLEQAHQIIEQQNAEIKLRNENLEQEVSTRTKELVEYNQQLEQFAFISSHNLRAPVARILGLGQLLELPGNTSEEEKMIKGKLIFTTQELDRVVKDLNYILEIRRNSAVKKTDIDLHEALRLANDSFEKEIHETHAIIHADFSAAPVICTVRPYLDSILFNLISNAIKYRSPDRTPIIALKTSIKDDFTCLVLSDNGLGIDLNVHKNKLFKLYSRFHNHAEGKGLGLYLVKTQVASLGGKIEVESEVNKGTTFYVYFGSNGEHS